MSRTHEPPITLMWSNTRRGETMFMKSLDEVQENVDQAAILIEHESIKVVDMHEEEDFDRLGIMKVLQVRPPLCQFHVSKGFYDLGPIMQEDYFIGLLAEALYLKMNPSQFQQFSSHRKNDPNITDSTFDKLKQEIRSKMNLPAESEA